MRLALFVVLLAACNGSDGTPLPDGGGGGGGAGGSGGGSTSPSAPKILTINTNLKTLHETGMLTVSAVVTDPDGIGDVIGGQLLTSDGSSAYGAFATDAGEGAYSLTLDWNAINATESIDTDLCAPTSRTFRASFFDAEGNSSYREVSVTLECLDSTNVAHGGYCSRSADDELYTLDHCGSCGHSCPAAPDAACGMLSDDRGVCFVFKETTQRVACSTLCTGVYKRCFGADAHYGNYTADVACTELPAATNYGEPFAKMECFCTDM
jgi:hypothetical protein